MMKFIVTGGAGFIGSHLVDELTDYYANEVVVVDDLSRGSLDNVRKCGAVTFQQCDLRYWASTVDIEDNVVFHLAAKVAGIHYNMSHNLEMMNDNLMINSGLVDMIRYRQPKALIWVSTACVYPHDAPVPTPESAGVECSPEPTNRGYGLAKWMGEQQAMYIQHELGVPTIVVRFFNAFGPRDYYDEETSHVAPALIKRVMDGEDPLVVWGTGKQTRALVDARDIAIALRKLYLNIDAAEGMIVNIGHAHEITVGDLAIKIGFACGRSQVKIMFDDSKPDGYARRAADTALLQQLIGWVPDRPIEETLSDMIKEYHAKSKCNHASQD